MESVMAPPYCGVPSVSHHFPVVEADEVVTETELEVVEEGLTVVVVAVDELGVVAGPVVVVVVVDVLQDASSIAAVIKTLRPNQRILFFNSYLHFFSFHIPKYFYFLIIAQIRKLKIDSATDF
jgi:hypothetical protein